MPKDKAMTIDEFFKATLSKEQLDEVEIEYLKAQVEGRERRADYNEWKYQMLEVYLTGAMGRAKLHHWRKTLGELKDRNDDWRDYED